MGGISAAVFFLGVALAAGFDVAQRRIPNAVNVALALVGFSFQLVVHGPRGLVDGLLGLLVGLGMLFIPFALRWFGAGDVKLAGAMGVWLGPGQTVLAVLVGVALGGVLSAAVALFSSPQTRRQIAANLLWFFRERREMAVGVRPRREQVPLAMALGAAGVGVFLFL